MAWVVELYSCFRSDCAKDKMKSKIYIYIHIKTIRNMLPQRHILARRHLRLGGTSEGIRAPVRHRGHRGHRGHRRHRQVDPMTVAVSSLLPRASQASLDRLQVLTRRGRRRQLRIHHVAPGGQRSSPRPLAHPHPGAPVTRAHAIAAPLPAE